MLWWLYTCSTFLYCGQKCQTPCTNRNACKPCRIKCQNKCTHSTCPNKCSDLCIQCQEPCQYQFAHFKCIKKCQEQWDREPCDKPCPKRLKCGHACIGYCGEPCPELCLICDNKELIFLGHKEDEGARFVKLSESNQVIESKGMAKWIKNFEAKCRHSNEIQLPRCPKCNTTIRKSQRFSKFYKDQLALIEIIKEKTYAYTE